VSGVDKLAVRVFPEMQFGPEGVFAQDDERFYAAPGATTGHDGTDRVIYDSSTGNLYLDIDGTAGAQDPVLMFTLVGAPTVVAADIALMLPTEFV
jgi:Ca2+-binding RTX toxin-like protein